MLLNSSHRKLWAKYRQAMGGSALPGPFDAKVLISRLAQQRGRPIELVPVAARPDFPCGLLITTDQADCIFYAADTTPLHQQHILLHEAAHLLCGHHESTASLSAGLSAGATTSLLPHLSDSLVKRILGRTVYSEPQEHEAELLASLIRFRAARDDHAPTLADGQQSRLGSMFGAASHRFGRHG
jgi:hypothetical protein